ncbi:hypothetical protein EDD86DRAFT_206975 [Gorgonomyces haynaldii]|nr:hypothetical protein EDD86DRAFT_206975 [Gorgonomyces haynaldii]
MWDQFNSLTRKLSEKINQVASQFDKENQEYLDKRKQMDGGLFHEDSEDEQTLVPWTKFKDQEAVKSSIMELSADVRNLTVPPPPEYTFSLEDRVKLCQSMLKLDQRLDQERFKLVPSKMNDTAFWQCYFYRFDRIIQEFELKERNTTAPAAEQSDLKPTSQAEYLKPVASQPEDLMPNSQAEDVNASDAQPKTAIDSEDKDLDLDDDFVYSENWEQELQQELEAENVQ